MNNYGVCFRYPQVVNTATGHWCGEFKEPVNFVEVTEEKLINKRGRKSVDKTGE
jgi:hypothetical protein